MRSRLNVPAPVPVPTNTSSQSPASNSSTLTVGGHGPNGGVPSQAPAAAAWNSLDRAPFRVSAQLFFIFGDIPAMAKASCTSGQSAYLGCRFCKIIGVCAHNRKVYFPLKRPENAPPRADATVKRTADYTPYNLPLRTDREMREDMKAVKDLRATAGVTQTSIDRQISSTGKFTLTLYSETYSYAYTQRVKKKVSMMRVY